MSKIVLISCVSKKLSSRAKACDLYVSPLFRFNLNYAKKLGADKIFILSAKYGLVGLEEEIDTYNKTLNEMKSSEIELWAQEVVKRLAEVSDLKRDEFIFLAGERYRKFLIPYITNYKVPMKGLGIGKQLKFLKENTK